MQNIQHVRRINRLFFRVIDFLGLGVFNALRLGSWYCCQCDARTTHLAYPKRSAPTNRMATPESKHDAVRNFIRSDRNILLQKQRSARYSQKFRDGIVERLTSGTATISQLCKELNISETDLTSWIADLIRRKQTKIDELNKVVNQFAELTPERSRLSHQVPSEFVDEDLIEGHYAPRQDVD